MSEDKTLLRALCDALSPFVPPEHDVLDAAEAVMAAIGIPAAALSALRDGSMVAVPTFGSTLMLAKIARKYHMSEQHASDIWRDAITVLHPEAIKTATEKADQRLAMLAAAKDARHGE